MQSRNQIIDDLAKLMTNAFGLAQNATGEIENAVKSLLDRYLADKGLVTREEFDVMKAIHSELQKELLDLKNTISSKTDCYSFGILLVSFSFKCFLKLQVSATIQLKSTNQKIILYPLEE